MNYKTSLYLCTLILLIIIIGFFGCQLGQNHEMILNDKPLLISDKKTILTLNPPLTKKYNFLALRVNIIENWGTVPPYTEIDIFGKGRIKIHAELKDSDGNLYESKILGAGGGFLEIKFDQNLPKNREYVSVAISSDSEFRCDKIIWYNFSAP